MNDTLQLIIVVAVITLAVIGLIRNIFIKSRRKSPTCDSCPLERNCKKSNREDCNCR